MKVRLLEYFADIFSVRWIFQLIKLFIVNALDMRTIRNQSEFTKKRISDAMKLKHQQRSETEKKQTAEKQSDSMKDYWKTIPKVDPNIKKT